MQCNYLYNFEHYFSNIHPHQRLDAQSCKGVGRYFGRKQEPKNGLRPVCSAIVVHDLHSKYHRDMVQCFVFSNVWIMPDSHLPDSHFVDFAQCRLVFFVVCDYRNHGAASRIKRSQQVICIDGIFIFSGFSDHYHRIVVSVFLRIAHFGFLFLLSLLARHSTYD